MTGDPRVILCAVDFSKDSEAALRWAAAEAARDGARLVALHVVHDPASSPGFYRRPGGDWLRPMEDAAKEMFAEFIDVFRAGSGGLAEPGRIETMLVTGLPPGRIAEVAEQIGADLVVVGSSGRTGMPHVMLGSVAQRVAQIAKVPVTVVKAAREVEE